LTVSHEEWRRPAAALGRLVCARGFSRVAGCPLFLSQEDSFGRMGVNGFVTRWPTRRKRHRVPAPPRHPRPLSSAGSNRRLIAPDRSGQNLARFCRPPSPFPSSYATPVRTRASARGMPTANFATEGLAEGLAPRLARRELPEPKERQLAHALRPDPLDVAGAAAR
jgi:hypothetical protein